MTARRVVKPSLLFVSALQNAVSAAEPRGPISRSMCATSFPSPTSDSPSSTLLILAIRGFSQAIKHHEHQRHPAEAERTGSCSISKSHPLLSASGDKVPEPVGRIACLLYTSP